MRNTAEITRAIEDENFNWLGRDTFIESFSDYLLSENSSKHVCIDGVWGSGKTTTVQGIINHIKRSSSDSTPPLLLYFDSWKLEHYEHPLFALLKVIKDSSNEMFGEITDALSDNSIKIHGSLNFPLFNVSLESGRESLNNKILHSAEYIDSLNQLMVEVIKKYKVEQGNTLIIFIDELDRAKPDFALKVIEMFHHLQDELPTHVVYSVDMNQLNSIIKHYYGYEYNTEIFTHKVFDSIIPLKKLSSSITKDYIKRRFPQSNFLAVAPLTDMIVKYCSISQLESLRSINRICLNLENRIKACFPYNKSLENHFFLESRQYAGWGYVELFVILESLVDPIKFRSFLKGHQIEELADLIAKYKGDTVRKEIWDLLLDSYKQSNGGNLNSKNVEDLNRENIMIALKNIFNPPSSWDTQSIFTI